MLSLALNTPQITHAATQSTGYVHIYSSDTNCTGAQSIITNDNQVKTPRVWIDVWSEYYWWAGGIHCGSRFDRPAGYIVAAHNL